MVDPINPSNPSEGAKLADLLASLQLTVAQELLDRIRAGECDASVLNVARQLLKDNNITSLPKVNKPLGYLKDELPFAERGLTAPSVTDLQ